MRRTSPPYRADHVGSLLRPPELLEARRRRDEGELGDAELREIEDRLIRDVVKLQEDAGLESITDGEYRRRGREAEAGGRDRARGLGRIARPDAYPQTFAAVAATSSSFAFCTSRVIRLPATVRDQRGR